MIPAGTIHNLIAFLFVFAAGIGPSLAKERQQKQVICMLDFYGVKGGHDHLSGLQAREGHGRTYKQDLKQK